MAQLKNPADIADFKYPPNHYTVVWLFDQSSCHRTFDDQALLAKNILVKDGGPRCVNYHSSCTRWNTVSTFCQHFPMLS